MANNRMFLMHRPSGLAVYLGKRMAWGWYGTPENIAENIKNLFDVSIDETCKPSDQDDFCIAMEDSSELMHVDADWTHCEPVDNGLVRLSKDKL